MVKSLAPSIDPTSPQVKNDIRRSMSKPRRRASPDHQIGTGSEAQPGEQPVQGQAEWTELEDRDGLGRKSQRSRRAA